jgi:hypothetical protein
MGMVELRVPVSVGELLDKIAILEIKAERITEPKKRDNVLRELAALREVWEGSPLSRLDLEGLRRALREVNERLWDIEDAIREKEREGDFGAAFIELARSVYLHNDERARIKREINLRTGSALVEEKSYREYRRDGASA